MRVVFIGTGEIGLPTLRALLDSKEHEVVGIVTQPDKPVGRSQRIEPPPIKKALTGTTLPILQPKRIKEILCRSATDLGRERYFQGAGMLDILRALQGV